MMPQITDENKTQQQNSFLDYNHYVQIPFSMCKKIEIVRSSYFDVILPEIMFNFILFIFFSFFSLYSLVLHVVFINRRSMRVK